MNRPATVEVQIRNIAFGGEGVGEVVAEVGQELSPLQGITAFVPFSAIGDRIQARIEERKKNHIRCEAGEVLTASTERVTPACEHFTTCGGCHFQHISSEAQDEAKRSMLISALRAARCSHTVLQAVHPLVRGEKFGYRRRLRMHVDAQGRTGFYQPRSRVVAPVNDCLVADAQIRSVVRELPKLSSHFAGTVGSVLLESDEQGVLAVLVAPFALSESKARSLLQAVKPILPNVSISSGGKELASTGRRLLHLPLPEQSVLGIPAGGFSQANWEINTKLIERCMSLLSSPEVSQVFDLYAGAGNFTLPLARLGKNVEAVEVEASLVRWGQEAARAAGVERQICYTQSSVEAFLKKRKLPAGAVVLADPPRSGLGSLVNDLQAAGKLLFVSCHLPSFVRDLKQLLDTGWQLDSIEPYDMFPQTTHMEILGVFSKN